ncbi:hypothetical protein [Salinispora sp. H7-4]|uniref:hypothetical protein n=1 Tax=Salinispora sp. H7-4 TaxID=2748321 RepID=UPI0035CA01E5
MRCRCGRLAPLVLVSHRRRDHTSAPPPGAARLSYRRLRLRRPGEVRDRYFSVRRRGLDPVEIRDFLHRVADKLTTAQTALVAVREENVRIKNALREWQSAQSARHHYR